MQQRSTKRRKTRRFARDLFATVGLFRLPLVLGIAAAFVLAIPAQTVENYRAIAHDIKWASAQDGDLSWSVVRVAAIAGVGLVIALLLGGALWYVARDVLRVFPYVRFLRRWRTNSQIVAWLPLLLAMLPALAMAFGCVEAALQQPNMMVTAAIVDEFMKVVPNKAVAKQVVDAAFNTQLLWWFAGVSLAAAFLNFGLLLLLERKLLVQGKTQRVLSWVGPASLGSIPLLALLLLQFPVGPAQAIGAVGLFCLFMTCLVLTAGWVHRKSAERGIPFLWAAILAALAFASFGLNDNRGIRYLPSKGSAPAASATPVNKNLSDNLRTWWASRGDKEKFLNAKLPYPIYVVAAQGGGIYAAYHAATFLAGTHDLCPSFRHHLFAISSVSGGSVGAVFLHALLSREPVRLAPCENGRTAPLAEKAAAGLSNDFLAPLVGAFLFPDFVQRFIPFPIKAMDRARGLERALESAAEKVSKDVGDVLASSYSSHWDPSGTGPALLFSTTEVESGRLRVISPFHFPTEHLRFLHLDDPSRGGVSLSTAAVLSARFPWITPAGWIEEETGVGAQKRLARIKLADGAYFENSGVTTALELVKALEREAKVLGIADQVQVNLIVLTSPEAADDSAGSLLDFGDLMDPIKALLSTRVSRAPLVIGQAEQELNINPHPAFATFAERPPRVRRVSISSLGLPLSLGWHLSQTVSLMIDAQNGEIDDCVPGEGYRQKGNKGFAADCVVDAIFHELNGSLLSRLQTLAAAPK